MQSTSLGTECKAVQSARCNETERSDTLCGVIGWAILITELLGSRAERYARNITKLLHCDNVDIKDTSKPVEERDIMQSSSAKTLPLNN